MKGFEGYLTPNSLFEFRGRRGEQREWDWFVLMNLVWIFLRAEREGLKEFGGVSYPS